MLSAQEGYALTREDDAAFAALVKRITRWLLAYTCACVNDEDDAKDLVQDVLYRAWKQDVIAQCGGDQQRIDAYLLGAMRNAVLNEYRRRGRVHERLARYVVHRLTNTREPETPLQRAIARDMGGQIYRLVRELPPRCRDALIFVRLLNMPAAVAADVLGISVGTLRVQLKKAYRLLREKLAALGYDSVAADRAEEKEGTP